MLVSGRKLTQQKGEKRETLVTSIFFWPKVIITITEYEYNTVAQNTQAETNGSSRVIHLPTFEMYFHFVRLLLQLLSKLSFELMLWNAVVEVELCFSSQTIKLLDCENHQLQNSEGAAVKQALCALTTKQQHQRHPQTIGNSWEKSSNASTFHYYTAFPNGKTNFFFRFGHLLKSPQCLKMTPEKSHILQFS